MMPAHIDARGELLGGTGDCGSYQQPPLNANSAQQAPAAQATTWSAPAPPQQQQAQPAAQTGGDATKSMQHAIKETLVNAVNAIIERIDNIIIAKLQDIRADTQAIATLVGSEVAPSDEENNDSADAEEAVDFS